MWHCRRKLIGICLHCPGGVDSFMTRIDMAITSATSIPDWTINSEVYGMKLCRLPGLEKVKGISLLTECNFPIRSFRGKRDHARKLTVLYRQLQCYSIIRQTFWETVTNQHVALSGSETLKAVTVLTFFCTSMLYFEEHQFLLCKVSFSILFVSLSSPCILELWLLIERWLKLSYLLMHSSIIINQM